MAGCGDSSPWRGCGLRIWPHVGSSQPNRSVRMQSCSGWNQELHCKVVTPCWRLGWPAFWMWLWQRAPSLHLWRSQGGKRTMLDIEYPFLVLMPLFHFVLPVASCCIGIENLHIEEGAASALVPKLPGPNVLNVRASQGKPLPSQRLEGWLNGHIRANLSEELSGDIPNVVMPDRREGTFGAAQGMVDRKCNTTRAVGRESGWPPTIPDALTSRKACLCRVNLYLAMGMAVSQEDATLSLAWSMATCCDDDNFCFIALASSVAAVRLHLQSALVAWRWSAWSWSG